MITKTIHYCWFGRGELPEKAKQCIESWKKFCPDYEIKEWNEDNFDMNSCAYVKEAYEAKKWAFVSDYARFEILYKYGGLYFDTDGGKGRYLLGQILMLPLRIVRKVRNVGFVSALKIGFGKMTMK